MIMSLGVAPANFKVAELFYRNRCGDAAVNMGFERGFAVDCATGWNMSDEEQMKDVQQRVCDEEPVLLIRSPVCRAFSTLIELTQADKLSEGSRKNLVEQCVIHLKFCFRMYETQRYAGRLFLHEHPCGAWSRDLSFDKEMVEMGQATCVDSSWQRTVSRKDPRSCPSQSVSSRSQAEHALLQQRWTAVLQGMKRVIDSVKAIRSMEVGITCEEPNVPELEKYADKLQNVFDNFSGVRLDPELVSASRKVEIDFMSMLEVHRKRPRSWATDKGLHVLPTKSQRNGQT